MKPQRIVKPDLPSMALLGSVNPTERERTRLLYEKAEVDKTARELKTKVAAARRAAFGCGRYMDAREYTGLERRLEELRQQSQTLQARVGDLTRQLKEENRARSESFLRLFHRVAQEQLDETVYQELVAETEDRLDGKDADDKPRGDDDV